MEIKKSFRGNIPLTILRLTHQGKVVFEAYRKNMDGLLGRCAG